LPLQKLALVLGGAASGKSAFAEGLVTATGRPRAYIATAQAWDVEMARKIAQHREARGPLWRTVEAPRDLSAALRNVNPDEAVLVDCATLWLSNQMLAEADLAAEEDGLLAALESCPSPVVVVSNEVGLGVVPDTPLGRRFREAQGRLNQRLARQADLAVLVVAGLPLVLKGVLP
jgi:adenosylcobinamide kinase/adenosylcobinamide-phosphate guanylyltransferase